MNPHGSILDLILADDGIPYHLLKLELVLDPWIQPDSYHPVIALRIFSESNHTTTPQHTSNIQSRNFRKTNFIGLSSALTNVDWSHITRDPDLNQNILSFTNKITSFYDQFVPRYRTPTKPPWSNSRLKDLRKQKKRLHKMFRQHKNEVNRRIFIKAARLYQTLNRRAYANYVRKIENRFKRDPRTFFSFARQKRDSNRLPSMMLLNGRSYTGNVEISQAFADYFSSTYVSNSPPVTNAVTSNHIPDAADIPLPVLSEADIASAINELKLSFATGPDAIPSAIFKRCRDALTPVLTTLFNKSLQQKRFPQAWKSSFMFPVYKNGNRNDICNYRGIYMLCAVSKIFEITISKHLSSGFKNIISNDQHGFLPNRSIETNLLSLLSTCYPAMDNGKQVDVIYTDFSAAFDSVNHSMLISKLSSYGVNGALVHWLSCYLSDRHITVNISSSISAPFTNTSGVPQGSILGPILFNIFINDVIYVIPDCEKLFYADDMKMFLPISDQTDCFTLQNCLTRFNSWCKSNCMRLNISKCSVISYTRKRTPIVYDYKIDDRSVPRKNVIRDLGVHLDSRLTLQNHYEAILSKAFRLLGFILRVAKDFKDPFSIKALYCAIVRPTLEFASIIWTPTQQYLIDRLESVQRKLTRSLFYRLPWSRNSVCPSYRTRCLLFGLEPLQHRRKTAQCLFIHKLVTGSLDAPSILSKLNFQAPSRMLRTRTLFNIEFRSTNFGSNDPLLKMISAYNSLGNNVDLNSNLNNLRTFLHSLI